MAYRQQAHTVRRAAQHLSIREQRIQLLAEADELDALAEREDHKVEDTAPRHGSQAAP